MIIDAHIHMGKFKGMSEINMSPEIILESMKRYKINYAIFSNIEGIEVSSAGEILSQDDFRNQTSINETALTVAENNKDKLGVFLWARPLLDSCDEAFEQFILTHKDVVKGIKIHPFHSQLELNHPSMIPYLKLCQNYNLPCLVHAAKEFSHPSIVAEVAKQYPDVTFIMGHMGLGTDNMEAAAYIKEIPNLYGDTAWVPYETVKKVLPICGSHKILFGTDSPINGVDTYANDFYAPYFIGDGISKEDYSLLMYQNAQRIFNL